jgi:hypothetical protein
MPGSINAPDYSRMRCRSKIHSPFVIPAQAGIHFFKGTWFPACAGKTVFMSFPRR